MKKFSFAMVLSVCLVFVLAGMAMAQTVNYSKITSPSSIKVYYANTWSDAGYLDLTIDVPAGGVVNWVELVNYTVSSSAGTYGNIIVEIWDASGAHSCELTLNQINTAFQGLPANQKFYIKFRTDRLQFPGNPLYLQRPTVVISVTQ